MARSEPGIQGSLTAAERLRVSAPKLGYRVCGGSTTGTKDTRLTNGGGECQVGYAAIACKKVETWLPSATI